MNENQSLGILGIGIALLVAVGGLFLSTYKINPGYAGVVYNMDGGIESDVLGQGFHLVAPWRKVVEYPVSTETVYYTKSNDDGDAKRDNSINVNNILLWN